MHYQWSPEQGKERRSRSVFHNILLAQMSLVLRAHKDVSVQPVETARKAESTATRAYSLFETSLDSIDSLEVEWAELEKLGFP